MQYTAPTRLLFAWILLLWAAQGCKTSNAVDTAGSAQAAPAAQEVDVFLLAGQSNMEGVGRAELLEPSALSAPNVFLYHSSALGGPGSNDRWLPLRPAGWKGSWQRGANDGATEELRGFGVELSIGAAVSRAFPQRRAYLIKHAVGGTSLVKDWDPDLGHQYTRFEATFDSAIEGLEAEGLRPIVRAIFWQQGETDAIRRETADLYEERLAIFIARMRAMTSPYAPAGTATNVRFILGQVIPDATPGSVAHGTYPYRDTIRSAQLAVATYVPNCICVPTDPSFETHASVQDGYRDTDNAHFNGAGITKLGEHMAAAYLASFAPENR